MATKPLHQLEQIKEGSAEQGRAIVRNYDPLTDLICANEEYALETPRGVYRYTFTKGARVPTTSRE